MTSWLLIVSALLPQGAVARKAAREIVKTFGREAVERAEPRVARLLETFGDDAGLALRKAGPAGVAAIERHGTAAVRILGRWGDDGARLLASEGDDAVRLLAEHGDEAIAFMIRHPGVGRDLVAHFGANALRARVSTGSVVTLSRLADPILRSGRAGRIFDVIERFGDRACRFLWRHKGTIFVTSVLVAFLADPEPYLDGIRELAVEPMSEAAGRVVDRTDWTHVFVVALILASVGLGLYLFVRRLRA